MSLLDEYPLDDVDLDRRVNDVLGVPGVNMGEPEGSPGVRYCKFISLDPESTRAAGHGRLLEFFVESRVLGPPRNRDGYMLDEIKLVSGVMMRRGLGRTSEGGYKMVGQFVPEDRFVESFLHDPVAKIRAARWFSEFRERAMFDEEVLEVVNRDFLPSLDHDPDHFKKVLH
jgi:hypothetical protein